MASIAFSQHLQTHVDVNKSTVDGGKSFDILKQGLPDPPCYDLVYRHGLDVDETGERLVMGSTTGGLWVSENQGGSWQVLSASLPPVYCVRFG